MGIEHSRPAIGVTFFVGSIMFTSASYLQYSETVNVERRLESPGRPSRWRPVSWEPGRIDWLAAAVQLVGTVFFNISTFAGMKHGFSTHQSNARVWAPDALGSICFLLSSELAYAEVCHRWVCLKLRSLSWRIVSLNLLGSIAFGAAAIASLIEPSSGEPISARVANGGTALGGLCFLVAALALMPEAAAEEHAASVDLRRLTPRDGVKAHPAAYNRHALISLASRPRPARCGPLAPHQGGSTMTPRPAPACPSPS